MQSIVRAVGHKLSSRVPVPFSSRGVNFPVTHRNDLTTQLNSMGSVGILFSIVSRCAESTASVQWRLYRTSQDGSREEITNHPALTLIKKPNRFTTTQELIETCQQHHDLTGEAWIVIGRNKSSTLPLELWPVRPDRMLVTPSIENFISEYVYQAPDGTRVPLGVEDVIFIRRPNPVDSHRGMGVIQSILNHIDGEKYSAEWNRNFFLNGAEPGGIIEVERNLSDSEYDTLAERWKEQHRGVANAHRVAILEQAHYVDRKFSQKDMQFTELSTLSDEKIRRAFGYPKPMLGDTEDSNRAVAQAAEYVFTRWLIVTRLERWKQAFNNDLLPLFGSLGQGYEFDYDSPVPEDEEAENRERDSKVNAVVALVGAGFDPDEVLEWADFPALTFSPPVAASPPPSPAGGVTGNLEG